jgi:uncharacterized protein (DUF2336 family)
MSILGDKAQPASERLDRAFLQTLSRYPTAAERERLEPLLENPSEDVRRDLIWSLITCSEFRFNH